MTHPPSTPDPRDLPHPDADALELTAVLAALADPARLSIVREVATSPAGGVACEAVGGEVPKSTRSHQIKALREAGVVRTTPSGRQRLVTLRREDLQRRFPGLLDAVLTAPAGAPPGAPASSPARSAPAG